MKQLLLEIAQPPVPSFDNFVPGQNAEVLHSIKQMLQAVLKQQTGSNVPESQQPMSQRFVYIWGASGSGKSHLLEASRHCMANHHDSGLFWVQDAVDSLDDAAQVALFNRYNQIRDLGGCLLVAGSATPRHMGLREDLATRLAWGLVYQLHPLSHDEKAQALKTHAQARGMHLPDDVIDYCLRHLRRDLPTLMSTLNALDEWSLTYQKPVTVTALRQLLQLPLKYGQ